MTPGEGECFSNSVLLFSFLFPPSSPPFPSFLSSFFFSSFSPPYLTLAFFPDQCVNFLRVRYKMSLLRLETQKRGDLSSPLHEVGNKYGSLASPMGLTTSFSDMLSVYFLFLFSLYLHPSTFCFHCFQRERKGKRKGKRETWMQERSIDWLPPVRTQRGDCKRLYQGSNPQPSYVP